MKNLKSTIEGVWVENKKVALTQSQKQLLETTDDDNFTERENLKEWVKSQKLIEVSEEINEAAQSIYLQHKPTIKEGDSYQLISVSMRYMNGKGSGLINCRVNDKHIQVRF